MYMARRPEKHPASTLGTYEGDMYHLPVGPFDDVVYYVVESVTHGADGWVTVVHDDGTTACYRHDDPVVILERDGRVSTPAGDELFVGL